MKGLWVTRGASAVCRRYIRTVAALAAAGLVVVLAAFAGPAAARHSARAASAAPAQSSCGQSFPSLATLEAQVPSGPQAISTNPNGTPSSGQTPAASGTTPSSIAQNYTIAFYPRLFTYLQTTLGTPNCLNGPAGTSTSPVYGVVPAVNNDTLYANFFLNFAQNRPQAVPQVLTIPGTGVNPFPNVRYSLLVLDVFGHVIQINIPTNISTTGHYLLVPEGWQGSLPPTLAQTLTVVRVPYLSTIWALRADKYVNGQNVISQADAFRTSLTLASLPAYEQNPGAGATELLNLSNYAPRAKAIADQLVESHTLLFFLLLQRALSSPTTMPLSKSDVALSRDFNQVFAAAIRAARNGNLGPLNVLIGAAQAAHTKIIDNFEFHVDQNQWVYFNNFAEWGTSPRPPDYLDRAGETEFLQLSNNATAAGYYSAFTDGQGVRLDGSSHAYRLTFSPGTCTNGCIPEYQRFWSLTAYLPRAVTLLPNAAQTYNLASYTPLLRTNQDGSITLYIQNQPPAGHMANWLPVPLGKFLLILRVYGPTGNTAPPPAPDNNPNDAYIPPKIVALSGT